MNSSKIVKKKNSSFISRTSPCLKIEKLNRVPTYSLTINKKIKTHEKSNQNVLLRI